MIALHAISADVRPAAIVRLCRNIRICDFGREVWDWAPIHADFALCQGMPRSSAEYQSCLGRHRDRLAAGKRSDLTLVATDGGNGIVSTDILRRSLLVPTSGKRAGSDSPQKTACSISAARSKRNWPN